MRKKLWLSCFVIIALFLAPVSVRGNDVDYNVNQGYGGKDPCEAHSYVCISNLTAIRVSYIKDGKTTTTADIYHNDYFKNYRSLKDIFGVISRTKGAERKKYLTKNKQGTFVSNFGVTNLGTQFNGYSFSSFNKQKQVYTAILQQFSSKKYSAYIASIFNILKVNNNSNWTKEQVETWYEDIAHANDQIMVEPLFFVKIQNYQDAQKAYKGTMPNFKGYIGTATNVAEQVVEAGKECKKNNWTSDSECDRIYFDRSKKGHVTRIANSMTLNKTSIGISYPSKNSKIRMDEVADYRVGYGVGLIRIYDPETEKNDKTTTYCYGLQNNCSESKDNYSVDLTGERIEKEASQEENVCKSNSGNYTQSQYGKIEQSVFPDHKYCKLYCTKNVKVFYPKGIAAGFTNGLLSLVSNKNSIEYNTSFAIQISGNMECKFDSVYEYVFGTDDSDNFSGQWVGLTGSTDKAVIKQEVINSLNEIYKGNQSAYTKAEYEIVTRFKIYKHWLNAVNTRYATKYKAQDIKDIYNGVKSNDKNLDESDLNNTYNAIRQYEETYKEIKKEYIECATYNPEKDNKNMLIIKEPTVTINGSQAILEIDKDESVYSNSEGREDVKDLKGDAAKSKTSELCSKKSEYAKTYTGLCLTRFYYRIGMNRRKSISININNLYRLKNKNVYDLNNNPNPASKPDSDDEKKNYSETSDEYTKIGKYCESKNEISSLVDVSDQSGNTIKVPGKKIDINIDLDGNDSENICDSSGEFNISVSDSTAPICPPETYHAGTNVYYWYANGLLENNQKLETKFAQGITYAGAISLVCNNKNLEQFKGGYEDISVDNGFGPISISDCLASGLPANICFNFSKRYYCQNEYSSKKGISYDVTQEVFQTMKREGLSADADAAYNKVKSTSPKCNCSGNNKKTKFVYRTISLDSKEKAFPGKTANSTGRTPGSNWDDDDLIKIVITDTKDIYKDKNNVMYKIILDSETIRKIRKDNKQKSYDNFDLDCNNNGSACRSTYLRETSYLQGKISGKCFNITQDNFYSSSCMNNKLYKNE